MSLMIRNSRCGFLGEQLSAAPMHGPSSVVKSTSRPPGVARSSSTPIEWPSQYLPSLSVTAHDRHGGIHAHAVTLGRASRSSF